MSEALTQHWHNPSSVHRPGQTARHRIELARRSLADLIGAAPREILLTSGGTESIDLAIRSALGARTRGGDAPTIVSTTVEHAAIRDLLEALEKSGEAVVRWAPVARDGTVEPAALGPLLEGAQACSIQWVNNETGAIQPVREIGRMCRERGVRFHCDATQWVGKMPVSAPVDAFDYLTFAPHKFHGPKGIGVLWSRRGMPIRPTIHGAQELGRRGGTENVPAIIGAGIAAEEALAWNADTGPRDRLAALRDRFEAAVLRAIPDAEVNGPVGPEARIWNTTNLGFPRLEAEALLLMLSERGVCASAGAACSSGSLEPSPVLLAMGVPPEIAHGSLRFSLSRETTGAEIDEAAEIVIACVRALRAALPVTS